MVINITHEECILMQLKSHPVLDIDIGFKNPWSTLHRMAMKTRMPEINVK